jgi:hypothetical protein
MSCMQTPRFQAYLNVSLSSLWKYWGTYWRYQLSKQPTLKVQHFSHQSPTLEIILSDFYPCPILTIISSILSLMLHSHPSLGLPSAHKPWYSKQNLVCIPCLTTSTHTPGPKQNPKFWKSTDRVEANNIQIICIYW